MKEWEVFYYSTEHYDLEAHLNKLQEQGYTIFQIVYIGQSENGYTTFAVIVFKETSI